MKKIALITICLLASVLCYSQTVPDTSVTIKTTNNELYKLSSLMNFASQNLAKSDASTKDFFEFQKQATTLLTAWFRQKEIQLKVDTGKVKKK